MQVLKKPSRNEAAFAETLGHLRRCSLFTDIAGEDQGLAEFCSVVTVRSFAAGEEIMREGDAGSEMFILVEGSASVFRRTGEGDLYRVTILRGEEHAFFGEGALLAADSRSATIRSDSQCVCLVIDRGSFEKFGREHPEFAFPVLVRIARAVMTRLRKSNHDLTLLYNALVAEIRGN